MLRHGLPVISGELSVFLKIPCRLSLDEIGARIEEGAESKQFPGSRREGALFQVNDVPEYLRLHDHQSSEPGLVVTMVVKESKGTAWANGVSVKVGEHLLAAFETDIQKEDNRNGFVGQLRLLIEGGEDGGTPMINFASIGTFRVPSRSSPGLFVNGSK